MQEVGEDPDDSPPVGRRSARARGRVVDESDPSDEEGGAHFVRRSSRAAKPVARLSPDWKGDDEDNEDDDDDEEEYQDESETSEPDPDDDDDAEPKRYSRRERTTIQRYSPPKPAERGGSAEDNAGGARGRGRPAGGGKNAAKNQGGFRRRDRRGGDDAAAPRRGHRWMDDTDDSDVDGETDAFGGAPALGFPFPGGGGDSWRGGPTSNNHPYPLAPAGFGGARFPAAAAPRLAGAAAKTRRARKPPAPRSRRSPSTLR